MKHNSCPATCSSLRRNGPCTHFAQQLFHNNGVGNPFPAWSIDSTYHLAIWIPGTMLPWEVLLPKDSVSHASPTKAPMFTHSSSYTSGTVSNCGVLHQQDPTPYITYCFKWALTTATSANPGQHMLNELVSLGYYPTEQNWVLVDISTGSLTHKSCVADIPVGNRTSKSYIVGSVQCASLAKKILAVIKLHGASGWLGFWEDLVSSKRPRIERSDEVPVWPSADSGVGSEYGDAAPAYMPPSGYEYR